MRLAFALIASSTMVAGARWPTKNVDLSDSGTLCDTATEQYLKVEAHDFHDHPRMTMTWRQLTGRCEAPESELLEWTAIYDESLGDSGPTEDGRVQLNLFICCPFGNYELEIEVQSYSEDGSTLQQRTSWGIKSGLDEYPIWDTVSTDLKDDERYSPTIQGVYTWPLQGETGFYRTLYAGSPLAPAECFDKGPDGTGYKGCYAGGIFHRGGYKSPEKGPDGMTPEACFNFCDGFDYFGLENGDECHCGTASEFEAATPSTDCGAEYSSLCTGDATIRCGGNGSVDVYENARVSQTMRSLVESGPYVSEGCFADVKGSRIMDTLFTQEPMSAEICYDTCIDGGYHYFGTQFGRECWCGKDSDLTLNGEEVSPSECGTVCAGSVTNETCGGYLRMSAYKIKSGAYVGCYADEASQRAMKKTAKLSGAMTNERCRSHCSSLGFSHAGTQYGKECWCSDDDAFSRHGESTSCDFPCEGDDSQVCGGYYAISVYAS